MSVLNTTGNTVSAMLVTRMVEGKEWILEKFSDTEQSAS